MIGIFIENELCARHSIKHFVCLIPLKLKMSGSVDPVPPLRPGVAIVCQLRGFAAFTFH